MSVRKFIQDYLSFTRRDRLGILALIFLIIIIYLLPFFVETRKGQDFPEPGNFLTGMIDTLKMRSKNERQLNYERANFPQKLQYETAGDAGFREGELFQFDPNTATDKDWQRLGLNKKTTGIIRKYVSKGGKFYKADDLMKIWGMPQAFYERIRNHIVIGKGQKNFAGNNYKPLEFKKKEIAPFSINQADSTALIALPGIGSKLASRIISFREKLGGFYSVEQIGETYGLADSVFQKIKPYLQLDGEVRKININQATKEELKAHPYFKWNVANAIVEYRNQHGKFTNVEDLRKIVVIDEGVYERIVNYVGIPDY